MFWPYRSKTISEGVVVLVENVKWIFYYLYLSHLLSLLSQTSFIILLSKYCQPFFSKEPLVSCQGNSSDRASIFFKTYWFLYGDDSMVSKLRLSFLCLFWSVHLLPLFKSLILLDILATKIRCPGSLLSEQSLPQNPIFNISIPLSHQSSSHGIQSQTTQKNVYCHNRWGTCVFIREEILPSGFTLPCFPGGQSPTLQYVFPVGAPVKNYVET